MSHDQGELNMKIKLLYWLMFWGELIDGFLGVISFGQIKSSLYLTIAVEYSKRKYIADQSKSEVDK